MMTFRLHMWSNIAAPLFTAAFLLCTTNCKLSNLDVVVHLLEWSHNDVAWECGQVLKPQGYAAVQVSPPQEDIQGNAWWTRYQPVTYNLTSRSGNEQEFATMVNACNAAGIKVYVDVVLNHMANVQEWKTGRGGSLAGPRTFPGLYGPCNDFHHNNGSCDSNCQMNDDMQLQNIWYCDLGLPDLATGNRYVQQKLSAYLGRLLQLGVAGFRLDAAKHIPPEELHAILAGAWVHANGGSQTDGTPATQKGALHSDGGPLEGVGSVSGAPVGKGHLETGPFDPEGPCEGPSEGPCKRFPDTYQEVVTHLWSGTAVQLPWWYKNGRVQEFKFSNLLSAAFKSRHLHLLIDGVGHYGNQPWADSEFASVFVANHDELFNANQRNDAVTQLDGPLYALALTFMLAYPYGQPLVLSSLNFPASALDPQGNYPGAPVDPATGALIPVYSKDGSSSSCGGASPYLCEHRWPSIAAMVNFRRLMGSAAVEIEVLNDDKAIAIRRKGRGYVLINTAYQGGGAPLTGARVYTGLPAGAYWERWGGCTQQVAVNSSGWATVDVPYMSALALQVYPMVCGAGGHSTAQR